MHRRSTLKALAVPIVAAAMALSACSSGDGGTDGSDTGTLTGDPVVIGVMCSCSGPFAGSLGGVPDVATAWTKYINNNGGINGHPVKVIVGDDGGDATKSQQQVRKLVEQDKVVAIIDEVASYDASWADYVSGKGVPVLAGVSFTEPMATNPGFFPTGSNLAILTYGMIQDAKKAGKTKLSILACAEAPLCAGYSGQFERISAATDSGVDVVYSSKISATQPNYTAQCLAAKDAGADSMYVGHGGAIVSRVVDQCVQQGYTPLQIQSGGDVVNDWGKDKNMNGVLITALHTPLHNTTAQGAKDFHDAVEKYSPDLVDASNYSGEDIAAWTGFQLFAAAAKAGSITPTSTPADVMKGLYALKDETLGGLTPPLNYTEGQPTAIDCYWSEGLENGEWTQPGGTDPICVDEALAKTVHDAFDAG